MGRQAEVGRRVLPSFEEAEGLGPQDGAFVRDLVAVLDKHGNLDRFGLCLLHDHFRLAPDEVLVETHDLDARTLQVKVEKAATTTHTRPSQWRFAKTPGKAKASRNTGDVDVESHVCQVVLQCSPISGCPGKKSAQR
ncbi:hypothetical protein ACGFLS_22920 [Streptomyces abikoensis]|uniref:hypothetical protein n=1 Tax=Streptomyces abikoensis TaxID=97398 RepID=UPI00371CB6BD